MSIGRFDIDLDSGGMHFQIGQLIRGREFRCARTLEGRGAQKFLKNTCPACK
jgi:hypothetical protein